MVVLNFLAEVVASSNSKRDSVQFSKQWPELFKSGHVPYIITDVLKNFQASDFTGLETSSAARRGFQ